MLGIRTLTYDLAVAVECLSSSWGDWLLVDEEDEDEVEDDVLKFVMFSF
jgi:hypothetical protein